MGVIEDKLKTMFPAKSRIPPEYALRAPIEQTDYLINGRIEHNNGGLSRDVYSPVCVETSSGDLDQLRIGSFPLLGENEALAALDAAVAAYDRGCGRWPTMSVPDRIAHVQEFAARMKQARDEVVKLIMWEIGKSRADSEREFDRTVDYIRDTVEALKELDRASSRFIIQQGAVAQVRRAPLGVVLCMGPYNYPLNETMTTLIPALIMGNTVIMKPPRLGALLYRPLLEAFRDCFPPGVVNCIYGEGARIIGPLMASGRIDVLAFIGSSRVADLLRKAHPRPHRLRCVLGLEAKNPAIVLPDADLAQAVQECVLGALSFNGQRCTAIKMIFVHSRIMEEFLGMLCEAVDKLKFGMPWEEGVTLTPMPDIDRIRYMRALIQDAEQHGALVKNVAGGAVRGTFFFPAVLYPVNSRMRVYHEEQFGPVIPVTPFEDTAVPIEYILNSNCGQQAAVFGADPDTIAGLIDPLVNQVCRVNINSQCQRGPDMLPFTGRKDSAEGTLSVTDALRVFSIRSLVAAKDTGANKHIFSRIVRERKSNFLSTDFIL